LTVGQRLRSVPLAVIKNPPVVFARQANFAAGNQQVNQRRSSPGSLARAKHVGAKQTIGGT